MCQHYGILDELITKELMQTKAMYEENFQAMEQLIDQWQPKASAATTQIKKQQERIAMLEEEMEAILMERIRDKANTCLLYTSNNRNIPFLFNKVSKMNHIFSFTVKKALHFNFHLKLKCSAFCTFGP